MSDDPKRWWCWCIESDCSAQMYGPYTQREDAEDESNVGCAYAHGIALLKRSDVINAPASLHPGFNRGSYDSREYDLIRSARFGLKRGAQPIPDPTPAEEFAT